MRLNSAAKNEQPLLSRVQNWAKDNKPMDMKLEHDIYYADKKDLNWEIFYTLIDSDWEKGTGYWLSAKVATTLLAPAIATQFYKNQNARISENVNDDFTSDAMMEIRRVIPNFDKEKSQFPNFIGLYLKQVGYTYNKDASAYEMKKTGIRIFSQNSITNAGTDGPSNTDPYFNTASDFNLEEEISNRSKQLRASAFQEIVINKKYSNPKHREIHNQAKDVLMAKSNAERAINSFRAEEREIVKSNIEAMFNSKENKDVIEQDENNTKINTAYWAKFLGGTAFYDDFFVEKIQEITNREALAPLYTEIREEMER